MKNIIFLSLFFLTNTLIAQDNSELFKELTTRKHTDKEKEILKELDQMQKISGLEAMKKVSKDIKPINMKDTEEMLNKNPMQGAFQKCLEKADTFEKQSKCAKDYREALAKKRLNNSF